MHVLSTQTSLTQLLLQPQGRWRAERRRKVRWESGSFSAFALLSRQPRSFQVNPWPNMSYTMNRRAMMGEAVASAQSAGPRPVVPARPCRRHARVRVNAIAAPERGDVRQIQRPDASGRFGKCVLSGSLPPLAPRVLWCPTCSPECCAVAHLTAWVCSCRFGGKYVPETLIPALEELEIEYQKAKEDPAFQVSYLQSNLSGE